MRGPTWISAGRLAAVNAAERPESAPTVANTGITTFGADFATANTEFVKRDTGRRGRQSQTWVPTEAGWRVVSAQVSFLPAQD